MHSELYSLSSSLVISVISVIAAVVLPCVMCVSLCCGSVEFISYYLDRTTRLAEMKERLDHLLSENSQLVQEETQLRIK